jgi:translocation and assembly module TamB
MIHRALRILLYGLAIAAPLGPAHAQDWIARQIERLASNQDRAVRVEGFRGSLNGDAEADRLTVSDRAGVWLSIEGVAFIWRPLDLVAGRIAVDRLSADRIVVSRLPEGPADVAADPGGGGLPELPVALDLRELRVGVLDLGPTVPGGPARLGIDGRLAYGGNRVTARLAVVRQDDLPARATLDLDYAPGEDRLLLDLALDEPQGGLVTRALGLSDGIPTALTIKGQGPLSAWRSDITGRVGDRAAIDGSTTIVRDGDADSYRLGLDVGADLRGLLPEALRASVGERVGLRGSVVSAPGLLRFEAVRIEAPAGRAALSGTVQTQGRTLDLALDVSAGPDSPLKDLGGAAWDGARLALGATGAFDRPTLTLAVDGEGLARGDLGAERFGLVLNAVPRAPLTGPTEIDLDLSVDIDGPSGLPANMASLVGDAPRVRATAVLETLGRRLVLTGGGADLAAGRLADLAGLVDFAAGSGDATAILTIDDLAALEPLIRLRLSGSGTLRLAVATAPDGGPPTLRFEGPLQGLGVGIPAADALLDGRADLSGTVRFADGGVIKGTDLRIAGGRATVTGAVTVGDGRLDLPFRAEVPDLAPVAAAIGTAGSGRLEAEGRLAGPYDALGLRVDVRAPDLQVAGLPMGPVRVRADLDRIVGPSGRVEAEARPRGNPLTVATGLRRDGDRLVLSETLIASAGARLSGGASIDLARMLIDGRLAGDFARLDSLAPWVGLPLSGRGLVEIVATPERDAQQIRLTAAAQDIAMGGAGVRALDLSATVADALRAPRIDARVGASGVAAGAVRLDRLAISATGPLDTLAVELSLDGQAAAPVQLGASATVRRSIDRIRIDLSRFDGRFADRAFALVGPARVERDAARMAVTDFRIDGALGRIAAEGEITTARVRGALSAAGLPLALASLIDPTLALDGTAAFDATLAGSPSDPRIDARLSTDGVTVRTPLAQAPIPMTVQGEAAVRGARTTVSLTLNGASGALDLVARMDAPTRIDLARGSVMVPGDGALRGSLTGRVALGLFQDLLAARGDRIDGTAIVDLAIAGTPSAPDYGGAVRFEDGLYTGPATGTALTGIVGRIAGTGDRLVVEDLRATTPGGGTVRITGALRPNVAVGPQIDLRLTAENAQLVRLDILTATVDAEIAAFGRFDGLRVTGPIRIRRADIRVPDRLPASIVDLAVEEKGRPQGAFGRLPLRPAATDGEPRPQRRPPIVGTSATMARTAGRLTTPVAGPSLAAAIALDLAVTAANQIFVRGRGLDAELQADARVTGTAAEPQVTGGLSLVRGRLDLLARTFEFRQADVTFEGRDLTPRLDVAAEARSREVTATVRVTGLATRPEIALTSIPELPQEEVLSRLLFEKSPTQLSAFEAAQLAQSIAQLAGIGGGPAVVDTLRRSFGLDRLEIGGGSGGGEAGAVSAGRYVNDRVYVGVEQRFTGESRARVEVEITDTIRVESTVGPQSGTGVGVNFRWDY